MSLLASKFIFYCCPLGLGQEKQYSLTKAVNWGRGSFQNISNARGVFKFEGMSYEKIWEYTEKMIY